MPDASIELDEFDLAILEIVQRDCLTPQRTIGEAVHLSAAAVQRRLKRMREAGVIRENVAVVDPRHVDRPITILVAVELASERHEHVRAAKALFQRDRDVQQCYYVTGNVDFMLVITLPTMAHYEAVAQRLFFDNENVKRFRTFVTVDSVKASLYVPTRASAPRTPAKARRGAGGGARAASPDTRDQSESHAIRVRRVAR